MSEKNSGDCVYEYVHWAILMIYVLVVPFSNLTVAYGMSLSFLAATAYFFSKIYGAIALRRGVMVEPEIMTIAVLLVYLIFREVIFFGPEIHRDYFGTAVLNFVMCIALLDDFKRRNVTAHQVSMAFSGLMAAISVALALGLGKQLGDAGRVTFLGINENELGLCFLAAFSFFAARLTVGASVSGLLRSALFLLSAFIIFALIGTGTRFALFMLVGQLVVLMGYHLFNAARGRTHSWLNVAMVAGWLVLVGVVTLSSQAMVKRLDPALGGGRADSAGVMELGGRTNLWKLAIDTFKEAPIWGVGREGYERIQLAEVGHFALPHNIGMEVAVIGGLVGFALLLVLVLQLLVRAIRGAHSDRPEIVLTIVPLIAAAAFLNIISIKVVWLLLALYLAQQVARGAEKKTPLFAARAPDKRAPLETGR